MLGFTILYFKGTRLMMFQLSGLAINSIEGIMTNCPDFQVPVLRERLRLSAISQRFRLEACGFGKVSPLKQDPLRQLYGFCQSLGILSDSIPL